jgi:hypothetical protein
LGSNDQWYRLPNTTLAGVFDTTALAEAALEKTRAATEKAIGITVTIEKWIVAEYSSARFNSDQTQPKK